MDIASSTARFLDGLYKAENCKLKLINHRADLTQPIKRGTSSRSKMLVVDKVQVPRDFPEAPPRNPYRDGGVVCKRVSTPIVVQRW